VALAFSILAHGLGDWRDPSIGPLGPVPHDSRESIARLRCLISALITLSLPGDSLPAARSAEMGMITESEKGTYHRIQLNLQALPNLETP